MSLVIAHVFSPSSALVHNEMVLVLVIEVFFATVYEHEHRHTTEYEHEFTNKSYELQRDSRGIMDKYMCHLSRFSTNVEQSENRG